jgi:hypothetical protein
MRFSAVSVATVLLSLGAPLANAQDTGDLTRVNQDELASFYGRMNVVVGSGARAFGMGGAFLARADDATAASWNPAGLSYLRRTEFSLVGVHNDFSQRIPRLTAVEHEGDVPLPVDTLDQLRGSVADFIGFAYPLRIKERTGAIQASYQRSFSFTGSRRSEGPVGVAGFATNKTVQSTEFTVEGKGGFDTVSLSSGFEIHPRVRIGLSVNRWINGFSQLVERTNAQTGGFRRIQSTWDISGTNFNLGGMITPTPNLNLGFVYKTPFAASVRLSKVREDSGVTEANSRAGDVEIRFPRVYGGGASYRATNTLTLSADFTRTAWSQATITNFFSLARPDPPKPGSPPPTAGSFVDLYDQRPFPAVEVPVSADGLYRQVDTNQMRIGAEWILRLGQSARVVLPLRAGFFLDGQPVIIRLNQKNASLPPLEERPTFSGYTAGVGVTIGGVLLDVAYIREGGDVVASRKADGFFDPADPSKRSVRYNRVFASMMVRFGPRR